MRIIIFIVKVIDSLYDGMKADMGLDDLIIRIGRMIAYQEYNTKSPLNGLAAKWAAQNSHLLPIDARLVALQHGGDPARRGGRAHGVNEGADLALGLTPDLLAQ